MTTLATPPTRTYAMHGGGTIRGDTPEALVRALRASSYAPCATERAFMEEMSERCRFYNGATIGTYTREQFVEDLLHNGFLKEIDPDAEPENIIPFGPNAAAEDKG